VRKAAAEALRSRSMFSYVPTMMAAMQSPIDVQLAQYCANGQVFHRLTVFQQGPMADHAFVSTGATSTNIVASKRYGDSFSIVPDKTLPRDLSLAQEQSQLSVERQSVNDRIATALRLATENDLPLDPQSWWNWWYDYNEFYRPPVKPISATYNTNVPRPYTIRFQSCFVAGTKVWTSTGPVSIELIRPGECVLGQNIETGELACKPVIDTTIRPASPLIVVTVGGESIRTTRGHPFWVSGIGWQMAKELKPGEMLHTPRGPLPIEAIGEDAPAICYNLVVAEFGNYFITDQQVLVHDNNLRQVSTATVPGLVIP